MRFLKKEKIIANHSKTSEMKSLILITQHDFLFDIYHRDNSNYVEGISVWKELVYLFTLHFIVNDWLLALGCLSFPAMVKVGINWNF